VVVRVVLAVRLEHVVGVERACVAVMKTPFLVNRAA
jgi:hypothetical protein